MELSIELEHPQKAVQLFGPGDRHLKMIREALGVQIFARNGVVKVTGAGGSVSRAAGVLGNGYLSLRTGVSRSPGGGDQLARC